MNLTLPPDVQKLIEEYIRSGRYESAEHVIAAAMMTLKQYDSISAADLRQINPDLEQKLAEGLAACETGDVIDGDAFFDQLDREEAEEERKQARKTA